MTPLYPKSPVAWANDEQYARVVEHGFLLKKEGSDVLNLLFAIEASIDNDIVKSLLSSNLKIDVNKEFEGLTPLMWSVDMGSAFDKKSSGYTTDFKRNLPGELTLLLLEKGADINEQCKGFGWTAFRQ